MDIVIPNKIGPYFLRDDLGYGGYSRVKLAIHQESNEHFACKIIPRRQFKRPEQCKQFEMEVRIFQSLNHPGIPALTDILSDSINYYLIMQLCPNGSLHQLIFKKGKLEENHVKILFYQILQIISFIHSRGIVHHDIKPENILFSNEMYPQIIDFGFSCFPDKNQELCSACGSNAYVSPESLSGAPYNGFKNDIWSLGIVLYVMLFGHLPWQTLKSISIIEQVKNAEIFIPDTISTSCRDLLSRILVRNPMNRPSIDEILSHPWFHGIKTNNFSVTNENHLVSKSQLEDFFIPIQRRCCPSNERSNNINPIISRLIRKKQHFSASMPKINFTFDTTS